MGPGGLGLMVVAQHSGLDWTAYYGTGDCLYPQSVRPSPEIFAVC